MKRERFSNSLSAGLLVPAVSFLLGVFLGQGLLRLVSPSVGSQLRHYFTAYAALPQSVPGPGALLSLAALYFRETIPAFLLGFTALGVLGIPLIALGFGTSLSFSVCCLTAAFGKQGVLLALGLFGLRVLTVLPCFLLIAADALEHSLSAFGRGRRTAPPDLSDRWKLAALCGLFLLGALCIDWMISPRLLPGLMQRINF